MQSVQRFSETKEDFEKKDKINRDLFGRKGNNSYLCSVKTCFDYPGKFPERASRIRHYPFKTTFGWFSIS